MTSWSADERLWRSVAETLVSDILPALDGPTRDVALQLSGLARYAATRGGDPRPSRASRLAELIGIPGEPAWAEVAEAASGVLCEARGFAVASDGDPVQSTRDAAVASRAQRLRDDLRAFLAEDLATAGPLLDTFARHGSSAVSDAATRPDEVAALKQWFSDTLGEPISQFDSRLISGGHSRRMLDVTVETDSETLRFVVRIEQGGVFATDGASEETVMRALHRAGVPVAPIRWSEPGHVLGRPFFVMERVEGDHDADLAALEVFAIELHRLHQMDVEGLRSAFAGAPGSPEEAIELAIARWEQAYRGATDCPVPLLDDAAAWLRTNLHPTGALSVVHGDPGPGNFIHRDGQIRAITDWEFAHIGDAAEDWVYLAALRGVRVMDTDEWAAWLERHVGVRYDANVWRAWTAFNLFKGACANLTAFHVFESEEMSGPNLLAVGTALHSRMLLRLSELIE